MDLRGRGHNRVVQDPLLPLLPSKQRPYPSSTGAWLDAAGVASRLGRGGSTGGRESFLQLADGRDSTLVRRGVVGVDGAVVDGSQRVDESRIGGGSDRVHGVDGLGGDQGRREGQQSGVRVVR